MGVEKEKRGGVGFARILCAQPSFLDQPLRNKENKRQKTARLGQET